MYYFYNHLKLKVLYDIWLLMNKRLHLLFFLVLSCLTYAQQESQYTQYMYNTIAINPAYAGSRGVVSVFALHRNQWVGLDGAPVTNNVSITTPMGDSNFGVGLSFVNDHIGPTTNNSIAADLAYIVPISKNYKLSFGVKATAHLFHLDVGKLNLYNLDDPEFQNLRSEFSPNLGTGLYFFSDQSYIGLAVPNFFETVRYDDNTISINQQKMHYYFMAGHVFTSNENLKFKPAFITKIVEGAPLQLDITANVLLHEKVTLGVAYRWEAALSGLIGFQISNSWFIGYGYDRETTRLSNYNSGSHELFLRYEFKKKNRITSPRFF